MNRPGLTIRVHYFYVAPRFRDTWLNAALHPEFSAWLKKASDSTDRAFCMLCSKDFSLSNMGIQALRSHANTSGHQKAQQLCSSQPRIASLFGRQRSVGVESADASTSSTTAGDVVPENLQDSRRGSDQPPAMFIKTDTTRAEVLWCLKTVASHLSYRSADGISKLFVEMFRDSAIVKQFSMGRDKLGYFVTYGLAPYFKQKVAAEISSCENFVVCFDEALNRVAQRCQMDLVVRFWNNSKGAVESRYFNSVFLGRARAEDLVRGFMSGLDGLSLRKIVQVSMDGPAVNWKMIRDLQVGLRVEGSDDHSFVDTGSCGLHVVNGAFQAGHLASGWNINGMLRSLYWLFKDSPARRSSYLQVASTSVMPLKFCVIRWTENTKVVDRFLEMIPSLKLWVRQVDPMPNNSNFVFLKSRFQNDKLLLAKLHFFKSVSQLLEPFLVEFQTSKPMFPLLFAAVERLLRSLMSRLVKAEVLENANTVDKLLEIDLSSNGDQLKSHVETGFGASAALKDSGCTQLERVAFFSECRKFLLAVVEKVVSKSPLTKKFVRAASCLSPKLLLGSPKLCQKRMKVALEVLVNTGNISPDSADKAELQFQSFCQNQLVSNAMKEYKRSHRLDELFQRLLNDMEDVDELFRVVRVVLMMSHGNAVVESGFSVNADILVENLKEASLVGQRIVYDAIHAAGGIHGIVISPDMLKTVNGARKRYRDALESRQADGDRAAAEKKRTHKRSLEQIKELEAKRQQLMDEKKAESVAISNQIAELRRCI